MATPAWVTWLYTQSTRPCVDESNEDRGLEGRPPSTGMPKSGKQPSQPCIGWGRLGASYDVAVEASDNKTAGVLAFQRSEYPAMLCWDESSPLWCRRAALSPCPAYCSRILGRAIGIRAWHSLVSLGLVSRMVSRHVSKPSSRCRHAGCLGRGVSYHSSSFVPYHAMTTPWPGPSRAPTLSSFPRPPCQRLRMVPGLDPG